MPHSFNQQVVEEFRANGGRVGGPFEGSRLVLLTTTGARTGARHTVPLGYLPDGGERILVIASAAGAPDHPQWFRNLLADPRATVEDGAFTYEARAVVLDGRERDDAFARAAGADPGWAQYQERTDRVLPVVALEPAGPPDMGTASWGEALRRIHDAFRREFAIVRAEVAASGPGLGAQLRVNCLTACAGLHHHHGMEDAGMLPSVADRHPELAPVVDRLRREHEAVAALLARLQEAVSTPAPAAGEVLVEVDRLVAELEAHLAYEEEQLIPVLDAAVA